MRPYLYVFVLVLLAPYPVQAGDCADIWYYAKMDYDYSGPYKGCQHIPDSRDGDAKPWCGTLVSYVSGKRFGTDWTYCANGGDKKCIKGPWVFSHKGEPEASGPYYGCNNPDNDATGNWCPTKVSYISESHPQGGSMGSKWEYCTPQPPLKTIVGGHNSVCRVDAGKATCTVTDDGVDLNPTFSDVKGIDATGTFLCGLLHDATVQCADVLGKNWGMQSKPADYFLPFKIGQGKGGSTISGQGISDVIQMSFVNGMYNGTFYGADYTGRGCVLKKNGDVWCGKLMQSLWDKVYLPGPVTQIAMVGESLCVLLKSSAVQCATSIYTGPPYGSTTNQMFVPYNFKTVIPDGAYDLVGTDYAGCGLVNGTPHCWQGSGAAAPVTFLGRTAQLLASHNLICTNVDHKMACMDQWDFSKAAEIPYGLHSGFEEITSTAGQLLADATTCIQVGGEFVRCWGATAPMGNFENMNGTPVCTVGMEPYCLTSFGVGFGNVTPANLMNSNSSETVCRAYMDPIPTQYLYCSNGIPKIKWPNPVCEGDAVKPGCALGSPRCDDMGNTIACGGFPSGEFWAVCENGVPTCSMAKPAGYPSSPFGN